MKTISTIIVSVVSSIFLGIELMGQTTSPNPLSKLMEEIQLRASSEAAANPLKFKLAASALADQQHALILEAAVSQIAGERRLAANLLAFASPSDSGTARLVVLADDSVPDVRYAALIALATVTDGTNKSANEAIIRALSESGNSSLTRDAAFAASTLKLTDALPLLNQLLEGDDSLNKRYAAEAAARYGPMAAILLPTLKQEMATTKNSELKALMEQALASIDRPADTNVMPPALNPHPITTLGSGAASSQSKPKTSPEAAKPESKNKTFWFSFGTLGLTVVGGFIALAFLLMRGTRKQ